MLATEHPFSETPIPGQAMSLASTVPRAALVGCLALVGLGLLGAGQSPAAGLQTQASARGLEQSLLSLLNRERLDRGLKPLRRNGALDKAARWQSGDMVERRYFDHERRGGPSLAERIRRSGYPSGARSWTAGENIALSEGVVSSGRILRAWMSSPGHRAEILSRRYAHIGIGAAPGSPYGAAGEAMTVTADFGARR
jgi:uncharacterized protein YkwD